MMKLYFSLKNAFSICTKPSSMSGGEYGAFWWGGTKPARTGLAQRFSCKERDMRGRKSPSVRALASLTNETELYNHIKKLMTDEKKY
ncbi:hypothetical protein [Treponema saccharophilum]|nr:hypothetical protein [Treponema saccharophilum]